MELSLLQQHSADGPCLQSSAPLHRSLFCTLARQDRAVGIEVSEKVDK